MQQLPEPPPLVPGEECQALGHDLTLNCESDLNRAPPQAPDKG